MDAAAGKDDGFSDLEPDQYIAIRIGDQISFFRSKSTRIEKRLKRLQKLIFVAAGTGTLLAAFGFEPWVPVATALVAAFAAYVDYQQLDNTLTKYNQAEPDLANADLWWMGLTKEEKEKNRDKLVKLTEHILESENAGWARRMQSAQAKLKESQDEPADVHPGGKSDHKADKPGTADGGT